MELEWEEMEGAVAAALKPRQRPVSINDQKSIGANGDLPAEVHNREVVLIRDAGAVVHNKEVVIGEEGQGEGEGEGEGERSVYFHHQHGGGVWKCRHCSWTYKSCGPDIDHFQSHGENCHLAMDTILFLQNGSKFDTQIKGAKYTDNIPEVNLSNVNDIVAGKGLLYVKSDIAIQEFNYQEVLSVHTTGCTSKTINVNNVLEAHHSVEAQNGIVATVSSGHVHDQVIVVNKNKLEVTEFDVERVLEEQETHDLYCPNCHSCITKRVILRKRKRTVKDFQIDAKRGKLGKLSLHGDFDPAERAGDNLEREPDVFRCLSCFSYFIPSESRFNMFSIFRKKENASNLHISQQASSWNDYWYSIFRPMRSVKNEGDGIVGIIESSTGEKYDDLDPQHGHEIPRSIAPIEACTDTRVIINEPNREDKSTPESPISIAPIEASTDTRVIYDKRNTVQKIDQGILITIESDVTRADPREIVSKPSTSEKTTQEIPLSIAPIEARTNTILIIGEPNTPEKIGQEIPVPIVPISASTDSEPNTAEKSGNEWEVLKSIVYGGLIESIASLGVVSSAAGTESSTLNIIALGLANLIGGFFVIVNNLVELRNDQTESTNEDGRRTTRYHDILGRKENFRLHAAITLLSYILFGLLPPVVYGFSFRKSDNKEFKIIAVAVASLLSIALLAIGKAHISPQRPYIKSLAHYIALGVSASGLSYVAGVMVDRLLKQLGLFDKSAAFSPPPPPINLFTKPVMPTWATY